MNLYEVIRWGSESDDPPRGGVNGWPDTCFLVRADTPDSAAALADSVLAEMPCAFVRDWSQAVYLLGVDGGTDSEPRVLRGPYIQDATCLGWQAWFREGPDGREGPWTER